MSRENAPEITRPCLTDDGQRVRLDEVVALLLSFGPGLHVEDHAFVGRQRPIEVEQDVADAIQARVALEGFAQFTPSDDVRRTLPLAAMRDMVTSLVPPLLKSDVLPDAGLRLELIAKQILQYERFASVEPAWAHFARVLLASGLSGLVFDIPVEWRLP